MNSNSLKSNSFEGSEDVLERATDALRHVEVPQGPSAQDMAGLLDRLARPIPREIPLFHKRRSLSKYRNAGVAALVVFIIVGGTGWLMFADKKVAFADALHQIRELRTISFRSTSRAEGQPSVVARQTVAAPRYTRISMRMGESNSGITIFDQQESAGLILLPATKQVMKLTSPDELPQQAESFIEFIKWLKSASVHSEEDLGPRKIGGKPTFGFRVSKDSQKWEIWIDQESLLPVRVETTTEMLGKTLAIVMDQFAFDHKLNLELFSLTPPPGYEVIDGFELREPSERDVVAWLRSLAERNDGEFPADLDQQTLMNLPAHPQSPAEPRHVALSRTYQFTRALMFLHTRKAEYTGQGVKLGDAASRVARWKAVDRAGHREIYGDLTIQYLEEDGLPSSNP